MPYHCRIFSQKVLKHTPSLFMAKTMHCLVLLVLLSSLLHCQAAVIGIDFGEEWFKVSIVKPGVPLDIVLNKESKRKTAALVQVRGDDRVFGNDALSLAPRFPQDTYPALKSLLGKTYDHPAAQLYRSLYTNTMVNTSRGTIGFEDSTTVPTKGKASTTTIYTVEELVGMQLAHAKQNAEISGGESISGAIITVPPFFNIFERRALLQAAEIAGVRVLTLMNDETAVALNYAMTRNFPEPQYTIFYDMGAGSTVASLVKFDSIVSKAGRKSNKTIASLTVQAVGYDDSLGGHSFDFLILEHLEKAFQKKYPKYNIASNPKARTKLLREASRVKQILSANSEVTASIEGVVDDIDFRLKMTRAELEEMAKPLLKRVRGPLTQVLESSRMKLKNIHSVVLVGGGVRIPAVQAELRDTVGEEKLAQNINGDEAAVLGAGFRSAGISKQFRVREIKVNDITLDPIHLVYTNDFAVPAKTLDTVLIPHNSKMPSKKLMHFKRKTDFEFELEYEGSSPGAPRLPIATVEVSGLTEAYAKFEGQKLNKTSLKAMIEFTDSGMLTVRKASVRFDVANKTSDTFKDKILNFFGSNKKANVGAQESEDPDAPVAAEEDAPEVDAEPKKNSSSSSSSKEAAAADNSTVVDSASSNNGTSLVETVALSVKTTWKFISPLTEDDITSAKERFKKMDIADSLRKSRDEARNTLEATIYAVRDFIEEVENHDYLSAVEKEALEAALTLHSDWLYGVAGDAGTTQEFKDKYYALQDMYDPIVLRKSEAENFPVALTSMEETLVSCDALIVKMHDMIANATDDEIPAYSVNDTERFSKMINETRVWLNDKLVAQRALAPNETPVILAADLGERETSLSRYLQFYAGRRNRKKASKSKGKATAAPQETSSASKEGSGSEEESLGSKESKSKEEEIVMAKKNATNVPDNTEGTDVPQPEEASTGEEL